MAHGREPAARFLEAFTADLVALELGPVPDDVGGGAVAWVEARIAGATDPARLGLRLAAGLIALGIRVRTGRTYGRLDGERRRAIAGRLAASRAPVVADFVKAVRSLAITYVYEAKHGSVP